MFALLDYTSSSSLVQHLALWTEVQQWPNPITKEESPGPEASVVHTRKQLALPFVTQSAETAHGYDTSPSLTPSLGVPSQLTTLEPSKYISLSMASVISQGPCLHVMCLS